MFIGILRKRVVSQSVFSTKIAIQILLVQIATFVKSKWGKYEAKNDRFLIDADSYSAGGVFWAGKLALTVVSTCFRCAPGKPLLFYPSAEKCTHSGCKCVQFQVLYCTKGKIVLISGANAYTALLNNKTGSFCWNFAKTIVLLARIFAKRVLFTKILLNQGWFWQKTCTAA